MLPCDKRYRSSKYFLQDQLRCSEAAADFRSIKELLSGAESFSLEQTFQFQTQPVPIQPSDP
jgi:hypothetical protein